MAIQSVDLTSPYEYRITVRDDTVTIEWGGSASFLLRSDKSVEDVIHMSIVEMHKSIERVKELDEARKII